MKRPILISSLVLGLASLAQGQLPDRLPHFDRRTPVVVAVENVGPAVVNIRAQAQVSGRRRHAFSGLFMSPTEEDPVTGRMYQDQSLGSGVVVHPDGFVVTNEHVVHGADRVLIKFQSGREVAATIVNSNQDNDVAVLHIEEAGPFPSAILGTSSDLLVGETVIALGNPFGLSSSATTGILSATGRPVAFRGKTVFEDFLQTSALINPGNSGGPLLDVNGRIIGINTAIDSRGQGIGFAIPINRVKEVMTELVDPALTRQATLGFEVERRGDQLVASKVQAGGPAAEAGVKEGDRVITVEGTPVSSPFEYNLQLLRRKPGDAITLLVDRGGQQIDTKVEFRPVPLTALTRGSTKLLGMEIAEYSEPLASRLELASGVVGPIVLSVDPQGSAAAVGLKAGDIVLQLDRLRLSTVAHLQMAVQRYRAFGGARIQIYREGEGALNGTIAF